MEKQIVSTILIAFLFLLLNSCDDSPVSNNNNNNDKLPSELAVGESQTVNLTLDGGMGDGTWTLTKTSETEYNASGNWNYLFNGDKVTCPFVSTAVYVGEKTLEFDGSGVATHEQFGNSNFNLNVSVNYSDNANNDGTYTIQFQATGWPEEISGTFTVK